MLPATVKTRITAEIDDWQGTGVSVMEVSHRGPEFGRLAEDSQRKLRDMLHVPEHFELLFVQGGASTQFALIPMNLAGTGPAAYAVDGHWGAKAQREAVKLIDCTPFMRPELPAGNWSYVHVTSNETIEGLQWQRPPDAAAPVLCDMSSDILSRPLVVDDYSMIYAGAQKNLGIAGLTLVIIDRALLDRCPDRLPTMINYAALAQGHSMSNTPPTFAWYVLDCMLDWIAELGGLEAVQRRNEAKASALYARIDRSDFYANDVPEPLRSVMNVVFRTPDEATDARFVAEAASNGLLGLKGHRAVGGLRASLYNAMEPSGVEALIEFMDEFERRT
ncbi:MAG: 3-phosphoserine/phosphohydroxythreonine transaminase [Xanthomonadales bacterium]|nr:3-phosphoserine/phosphohydroxythreonine transaminase [Xanthomonadales bacterium]